MIQARFPRELPSPLSLFAPSSQHYGPAQVDGRRDRTPGFVLSVCPPLLFALDCVRSNIHLFFFPPPSVCFVCFFLAFRAERNLVQLAPFLQPFFTTKPRFFVRIFLLNCPLGFIGFHCEFFERMIFISLPRLRGVPVFVPPFPNSPAAIGEG